MTRDLLSVLGEVVGLPAQGGEVSVFLGVELDVFGVSIEDVAGKTNGGGGAEEGEENGGFHVIIIKNN